ncbi:conserved protein of unknown function [Tepidanaerobacter acetatoxydans Re1]|uniref:Asp23/Gls24 family envelope stress response protein n=1 Tax=Tepidanaerobacter acetatoxydans (strain DSM 21804 / JCM 16047 / Re1) TaxID=1209989 RepID=F4LU46_TEPAE|nr:Asp23/Gls24 family envelope stress response protein [Tepidanaerobacter acetatoxydans]AEE90572.1 hypothetical protein TepRe1_0370 [Tepidanaerobacter acetatoxydans Re1]CCP25087.1 conserved protein of unknown function [Tepidanaerobacter acetatoxydans Re1]
MRTLALIGKSGTGKSHKAQIVAKRNGINFIIDDGLLIHGSRVLAGYSAKRETTRVGAIRRAIFQDPAHADEVKSKISEMKVDSLLILGTSYSMIEVICKTLDIPMPEQIIKIEDVSSPREINTAIRIRETTGKHIIPVPTLEIKKDFSGFLLDPLRIFRKGKSKYPEMLEEKSVVRPTYSYMGRYTINDTTVNQIALYTARQVPGIGPGGRVFIENNANGVILKLELSVEYGIQMQPVLTKVKKKVTDMIEHMTGLNVLSVEVIAKNLYFKSEPKNKN